MPRRIFAAAGIFVLAATQALAIDAASVPPKFPIPWGNSAGSGYIRSIPTASQIGITNGAASLTDGFPPLTFVPVGAGGVPPFGQDFNGILKQLSQWAQWQGAGAAVFYDSGFSSSIGGYPQGAILANASTSGAFWFNTTDNNTTDPDTGGSGWTAFSPVGAQTRSVSTSGAFTINATDQTVGIVASAASSSTLPTGVSNGKKIVLQDLGNNFSLYNVTISAPGGETIAGLSSVTLNINQQDAEFTYYSGANVWSFNGPATPPVATIQIAAGGSADSGYLLTYGQPVSRTTYAALFAKIGTTYGTGDGSTTFNLPDLRGRVPAGQDNMGGTAANRITNAVAGIVGTTLGAAGGTQGYGSGIGQTYLGSFTMSLTSLSAYVPATNIVDGATFGAGGGSAGSTWDANPGAATTNLVMPQTNITLVSGSVASGGSGTAFSTTQPTQIVAYEIKY